MKTLLLVLLMLCVGAGAAYAYDRTLITDQTDVGGFAAVVTRFTEAKEEFATLAGGRIGVLLNHSWGIGLAGYGTVVKPAPDDLEGLEDLEMAYGGMTLEYILKPHAVLHVCLPVFIGGGQVQFSGDYLDPDSGEDSDAFFVVEPEMSLEFNISRNLRVDVGIGYRHVTGTELVDITDEDLSGVNGAVNFKIGSF